jgi:hypothetical protein
LKNIHYLDFHAELAIMVVSHFVTVLKPHIGNINFQITGGHRLLRNCIREDIEYTIIFFAKLHRWPAENHSLPFQLDIGTTIMSIAAMELRVIQSHYS